jgi:hypothetical protein
MFAALTLTCEDAKAYMCRLRRKRRVRKWADIQEKPVSKHYAPVRLNRGVFCFALHSTITGYLENWDPKQEMPSDGSSSASPSGFVSIDEARLSLYNSQMFTKTEKIRCSRDSAADFYKRFLTEVLHAGKREKRTEHQRKVFYHGYCGDCGFDGGNLFADLSDPGRQLHQGVGPGGKSGD